MTRRWRWGLLGCAVACLLAPDASAYLLRGSVLGNGGEPAANSSFRLIGTAGQPAVGTSASSGFIVCHGYWCYGGARTVSVELPGGPANLPATLELGPAVPNPARGSVTFSLALPKAAEVRVVAYDARGRQVGEPLAESFVAGRHTLYWRGAEEAGAGSGVYFVRLFVSGKVEAERRIVILR